MRGKDKKGNSYTIKLQEKKQTTAQQEQASIAITLYYEIQNTAILPDKVTPPQPASYPANITFNDKTHLSLREAPPAPIQYKEAAPPPSPDSVSSSILHSTSNNSARDVVEYIHFTFMVHKRYLKYYLSRTLHPLYLIHLTTLYTLRLLH